MKSKRNRRMRVEGLEDRQLMAGDVTVSLNASTRVLTVIGDGNDNGVAIATEGGVFKVIGLEQGGSATTINGNYRESFRSVVSVNVFFGSGDDALAVTNLSLIGGLNIDMGDGDDQLGLGQFDNTVVEHIFGLEYTEPWMDKTVDPRRGALVVKRELLIDLGDGENELRARATSIGFTFDILGGIDDDKIDLSGVGTRGRSGYIAGVTASYYSTIFTLEGDDTIKLDQYGSLGLALYSGTGEDKIELSNLAMSRELVVDAGADRDEIHLTDVTARNLSLLAGSGDDDTYLKNVKPKSTSINDGGTGDNVYHDLGGNANTRVLRRIYYNTVVTPDQPIVAVTDPFQLLLARVRR